MLHATKRGASKRLLGLSERGRVRQGGHLCSLNKLMGLKQITPTKSANSARCEEMDCLYITGTAFDCIPYNRQA